MINRVKDCSLSRVIDTSERGCGAPEGDGGGEDDLNDGSGHLAGFNPTSLHEADASLRLGLPNQEPFFENYKKTKS